VCTETPRFLMPASSLARRNAPCTELLAMGVSDAPAERESRP